MPSAVRVVTRVQDQDDFSGALTDGQFLKWDSGTSRFLLAAAAPAIGTAIGSATVGSVLFVGAGSVLGQDNANLFWDDTNNRLGIGTASPGAALQVNGAASGITSIFRVNATTPGDITQWQDSAATKKAWIASDLNLCFTGTGRGVINDQRLDLSGANTYGGGVHLVGYTIAIPTELLVGGAVGSIVAGVSQTTIIATASTAKGLTIKGAPSQTANLQDWQNSSGTVLSAVNSAGVLTANTDVGYNGFAYRMSASANTGLYNDQYGNNYFKVNDVGIISFYNGGSGGSAGVYIYAFSAASIAQTIRGVASRTAPLLQFQTSTGASLGNVGGTIFNSFTDTPTTNVDGTEDDLYSYTLVADTFAINGDSVHQREHVQFVSSATATRRLKKYFGGTLIFDSGAITLTLGGDFFLETMVIRESSTVVRVSVNVVTTSASSVPYATYTRITGLTLTNTQILKSTGIAAGAGAASGDIINKLSKVTASPAA